MLEAFERHLKQQKNLVELENIETQKDLLEFCQKTLEREGFVVRKKNEFLYAREEISMYDISNSHKNEIIEYRKRSIKNTILESFLEKFPITYTIKEDRQRYSFVLIGKLEI
jgi:hypothetical protein